MEIGKGEFENMLLAAGYKQEMIDEMVIEQLKEESYLTREDICEAEVEAWS